MILRNAFEQQSAYMLSQSVNTETPRFIITDRTGEFDPTTTRVIIQRGLNISGTISYQTIAGDEAGTDGYEEQLAAGERYRILVENEDGETRVPGSYRADATATIELQIGQVVADPDGPDQVAWSAERLNESGTTSIVFEYNDSSKDTSRIWLHIYERGNESNELLANTSFTGTYGTFKHTETLTGNDTDKEWVVEFTAERSSENESGSAIVGPTRAVLTAMPIWLRTLISVGTIWVVAGLFSQLNGDVGALVVAGLGGLFWYIDFLPPDAGIGVVLLSMITAGVIFINGRRGV